MPEYRQQIYTKSQIRFQLIDNRLIMTVKRAKWAFKYGNYLISLKTIVPRDTSTSKANTSFVSEV